MSPHRPRCPLPDSVPARRRTGPVPPSRPPSHPSPARPAPSAGDNFQKPPANGKGWYHSLAAQALAGTAAAKQKAEPLNAAGRGLAAIRSARLLRLTQPMRQADDQRFAWLLNEMRRTDVPWPVRHEFIGGLKPLCSADVVADPEWRFAPIGVLSRLERDVFNEAQAHAFAKTFGLPLVRWRRQLMGVAARLVDADDADRLFDEEVGLWDYFVEGAPYMITENISSVRKQVNGSQGVLDSLGFRDGPPSELRAAYERGGYQVVTLDERPLSVNVRPDDMDDVRERVTSLIDGDVVVLPLLCSSNQVEFTATGVFAATKNIPREHKTTGFPYVCRTTRGFAAWPFADGSRLHPRAQVSLGLRVHRF